MIVFAFLFPLVILCKWTDGATSSTKNFHFLINFVIFVHNFVVVVDVDVDVVASAVCALFCFSVVAVLFRFYLAFFLLTAFLMTTLTQL